MQEDLYTAVTNSIALGLYASDGIYKSIAGPKSHPRMDPDHQIGAGFLASIAAACW